MYLVRCPFLVAVLYALWLCGSAFCQISQVLEASAHKAWADYENVARLWSYKIHTDATTRDSGKTTSDATLAITRSNSGCASIEEASSASDPEARECRVVNSKYQFSARRPPGGKEWALTGIMESSAIRPPGEFGRITMRNEIETKGVLIPVSFELFTVRRLIDHPCCQTTRFAQTAEGVEWLFDFDNAKRPERMRLVNRGRIVFDPANHWVIKELGTENPNGAGGVSTIKYTMTYEPGPNGYPVLRGRTCHLETDDKSYEVDLRSTFERIPGEQALPDSKFTLTAYGIPEAARHSANLGQFAYNERVGSPPRAQVGGFGWYGWGTMIAGAFLAVGLLLLGVSRWRRAT
jgi:hypothetical protein